VIDAPSGKSPPVVLVVEDDPLMRMLAVEVQPSELPPSSRFVRKPYRAATMVEELRSLVGSL
jgi:hypothetical protein